MSVDGKVARCVPVISESGEDVPSAFTATTKNITKNITKVIKCYDDWVLLTATKNWTGVWLG